MTRFVATSITQKILLSFIGIFAITYVLTAVVVFTSVYNEIVGAEKNTLSQLAESKAERLVRTWTENAVNLRAWSSLDVMNDLISGDVDKRIHLTLEGFKNQYELSGDIYAFDTSGKLIASSTDIELRGEGKAPANWIPHGNSMVFVNKHSNPFDGQQIVAQVYQVNASFSLNYPIGFLVMTFPWNQVEHLAFGGNVKTVLLQTGQTNNVLATDISNIGAETFDVKESSMPTSIVNGVSYVVGRAQIAGITPDWEVLTLQQTDVVVRSVRKGAWELAVLGLLISIPIIIGVRWLAGKLTKPVVELTAFVTDIANSKDLDKRVLVSGHDELSVLAQSFNFMAAALQNLVAEREHFVIDLENKVTLRTQELTTAFNDLKAAQGQLVQSEKMASLGQLVAGVAHELNNPIAFIYANFPHLEEYVRNLLTLVDELIALRTGSENDQQIKDLIAKADLEFLQSDIFKIIHSGQSGASRVKEIVRSLRSFSRVDEGEFKSVCLEDGIKDTLAILKHELRGRIQVETQFLLDQPVSCFSGQINQVFMNIIYNAIQAIKGEGLIRIITRREEDWAVVTIVDSGSGIPPEIIERIFDPFFTTKKVGDGTGLGLSISYGIIEKHGGKITVQSEVGVGTTFEIRIPLQPIPATELGGEHI